MSDHHLPLEAIAGRWRTDGRVLGDEPVRVSGTDTYELLAGGHFLVHHVDVVVGTQSVVAIEVIGERDPVTDATLARAYDNTGAMTVMIVDVDADGVWRFTGGSDVAPAARAGATPEEGQVRSTLTVAPDGRSMTALWERADDGTTWVPWMDMHFTLED